MACTLDCGKGHFTGVETGECVTRRILTGPGSAPARFGHWGRATPRFRAKREGSRPPAHREMRSWDGRGAPAGGSFGKKRRHTPGNAGRTLATAPEPGSPFRESPKPAPATGTCSGP